MKMMTFLHYLNEALEGNHGLQSLIYDEMMNLLKQIGYVENDTAKGSVQESLKSSQGLVLATITQLQTAYQEFYLRASHKHFGFITRSNHTRANEYGKACMCALLIATCYKYLEEWNLTSRYAHLAVACFHSYIEAIIDGAYIYESYLLLPRRFGSLIVERDQRKSILLEARDVTRNERKEFFEVLSKLAQN